MKKLLTLLTALSLVIGAASLPQKKDEVYADAVRGCGDVNLDDKINTADVMTLLQIWKTDGRGFVSQNIANADVNRVGYGQGTIDVTDITIIVAYIFHQEEFQYLPWDEEQAATSITKPVTTTSPPVTTPKPTAIFDKDNPLQSIPLGTSMSDIDSVFGVAPKAYYDTANDTQWKVYGSYKNCLIVEYVNNKAVYLYANYGDIDITNCGVYRCEDMNNQAYAVYKGTPSAISDGINARLILDITNMFRVGMERGELTWNDKLATAAQLHAEDMGKNNYFDHDSLDGTQFFQRIKAQGYDYGSCAENIAFNYRHAFHAVDGWINSEGHRLNILDGGFTELGVGYYTINGQPYSVQEFGTPWN